MDNQYSKVLLKMMTMLNQIKLYHWQTLLHPRHVATDKLYEELNELIDKFIESLTGRLIIKNGPKCRIQLNEPIILDNNESNNEIGNKKITEYIIYLESLELNDTIGKFSDLLNIKDEMLCALNKVAYLFSLK